MKKCSYFSPSCSAVPQAQTGKEMLSKERAVNILRPAWSVSKRLPHFSCQHLSPSYQIYQLEACELEILLPAELLLPCQLCQLLQNDMRWQSHCGERSGLTCPKLLPTLSRKRKLRPNLSQHLSTTLDTVWPLSTLWSLISLRFFASSAIGSSLSLSTVVLCRVRIWVWILWICRVALNAWGSKLHTLATPLVPFLVVPLVAPVSLVTSPRWRLARLPSSGPGVAPSRPISPVSSTFLSCARFT